MDVNTRNRAELKSYFVKNSIPTESNFAELIDGLLNQKDDGVVKLPGNPLTIEAAGDANSEKRVLNIYPSFGDQNPAWTLMLNPRANPNEPATARPGFNISDGQGRSRLFIDRSTGNIGVGTIEPATAKLEVNGSFKASANASGQGDIWMEAPADGRHRLDPAEGEEDSYKTGLVYRVRQNPRSGAPIFQVRSSGQAVRLFVDHDGWTGSRHNSAWFEGGRNNYFAGSVGIGTSEPEGKLDVRGQIRAGNSDIYFTKTDHNHSGIGNANGFAAIENAANYDALMILGRAGTEKGRYVRLWDYLQINGGLDVTGNVGIGTSSVHNPQGWNKVLDILGSSHARLNVRSSGGVITSVFSHDNWGGAKGVIGTESKHPLVFATNYTHQMVLDTSGNVGIGTMSAPHTVSISNGGTFYSHGRMHIHGEELLYLLNKSGVIIGREWGGSGSLTVQGPFKAPQKFFEIPHPTKTGLRLVHACVEGPELAVYYRGEAQLVNGRITVELPAYFETLTRKEGRTVQLTPKGAEPYLLSYADIVDGAFKVYGAKSDGVFSWEVKATRADIDPLAVEVEPEPGH